MATWADFETASPELAAGGRRLLYPRGEGEALLATVRDGDAPRIHPVNVGIVNGRLYVFVIARSAKRVDLETDGRYALHAHVDPASPSEFMLRGRARAVTNPDERAAAAADWPFTVDEGFHSFELSIDAALLGERPTADDWPPRYASWVPAESAEREKDNKAVARRFIDEIFVAMNADAVDDLLTDDFTPHTWGATGSGRDDMKAAIERVSAGLSDVSMTVEEMIAESDLVAVRLTASATQTGEFMKLPPSGKRYEIGEIHIFRIRDGRVAEHWHQADLLGLMRQLGALPGSPS